MARVKPCCLSASPFNAQTHSDSIPAIQPGLGIEHAVSRLNGIDLVALTCR